MVNTCQVGKWSIFRMVFIKWPLFCTAIGIGTYDGIFDDCGTNHLKTGQYCLVSIGTAIWKLDIKRLVFPMFPVLWCLISDGYCITLHIRSQMRVICLSVKTGLSVGCCCCCCCCCCCWCCCWCCWSRCLLWSPAMDVGASLHPTELESMTNSDGE